MTFLFGTHKKSGAARGFTLIELLVVAAIIVVITGIIFTSRSDFNSTIILSNTAYDIALTIRNTQNYGIGSKAVGIATNVGHGVHFESATKESFVTFSDTNPSPSTDPERCHPAFDTSAPDAHPGNCTYEATYGAGQSERTQTFLLGNGITVDNFCAKGSAPGSWSCANTHNGNPGGLTSLDITFTRPNAEMVITKNGTYDASTPVTEGCIFLASQNGALRYIFVNQAGLVRPTASDCTL